MNSNKKLAIGLAIIAIILWSTVATVFKLGLRHYSPYQLVLLASFISAIALVILALIFHRESLLKGISTRRELGLTLMQALLNPFLYYGVLFEGYNRLPAQIAQPLNFTWPIFLAVFAVLFLGEKFRKRTFPALLLSFTGIIVVSINGGFTGNDSRTVLFGVILCLLSAVIWALYWLVNIQDARKPLVKLTWSICISVFFIWTFGFIRGNTIPSVEFPGVIFPVYIGLFEMSITFFIWLTALEKARNTALMSNLAYLIPVLSLGVIWLVLGENLKLTTVIGLALIICGVIIQSGGKRKSI